MRRVEGSAGVSLMECTNPVKDKWRIRWDVQEKENGSASYMEEEFGHKPTDEEIRTLVMSWYNSQTDAAILSGFAYNGAPVWLLSLIHISEPTRLRCISYAVFCLIRFRNLT